MKETRMLGLPVVSVLTSMPKESRMLLPTTLLPLKLMSRRPFGSSDDIWRSFTIFFGRASVIMFYQLRLNACARDQYIYILLSNQAH